jgi:DNA-binding MarR family transcriptional regulator
MKQLNNSTTASSLACGEVLLDVVPLLMAIIREESRAIQPSELTPPQFRALAFIDRHDGMSLSAVSEMLGLTLSSVSKLMEGLVEMGYVRQEICPQDRRRAQLHSTAKGRTTMTRARGKIASHLGDRLEELSPEVVEQTMAALQQLHGLFAPPRNWRTLWCIPNSDRE